MFRRLDAARTYALPCSNGKAPPAAPFATSLAFGLTDETRNPIGKFAEYSLRISELLQLAMAYTVRKQAVQERREERRGWKLNITTTLAKRRAENVRILRLPLAGSLFQWFTQLENQREVPLATCFAQVLANWV
jgi:hypothetical protein